MTGLLIGTVNGLAFRAQHRVSGHFDSARGSALQTPKIRVGTGTRLDAVRLSRFHSVLFWWQECSNINSILKSGHPLDGLSGVDPGWSLATYQVSVFPGNFDRADRLCFDFADLPRAPLFKRCSWPAIVFRPAPLPAPSRDDARRPDGPWAARLVNGVPSYDTRRLTSGWPEGSSLLGVRREAQQPDGAASAGCRW